MVRYIRTAETTTAEDAVNEALSTLKDDFDYAIDGISKLAADGDTGKALELANGLSEMINASIEEIAENVAQGE